MERLLVLAPAEDRAGRAIALAGRLAEATGARIDLLRVLEENLGTRASAQLCLEQTKIRELLLRVEREQLEELATTLRDQGTDVTADVCWGVPWEVVLERAERIPPDLIVKPATGLNKAGRVFFGSTALHLFRRATCPVWVVGDEGVLPERILAAVDPTGSETRQRSALRIVEHALSIGAVTGGSVQLATAWHPMGAELLESSLGEAEWKAYREEAEKRARDGLQALAPSLDGAIPPEHMHLVEGEARDALPRFAREQDFDLVVLGTLSRPGAVGDLLGATAETVLREVRSSVMTVPPAERNA